MAPFVTIEEFEPRMLLSTAIFPAVWQSELSVPASDVILSASAATLDPKNGETLVAYETFGPGNVNSNGGDNDLVVAAFKSDGQGGLTLDTSFGGQSDDPDVFATPGFEIVDLNQILGVDSVDQSQGDSFDIHAAPLGITVQSTANGGGSGDIDLLVNTFPSDISELGIVQLTGSTANGYWGTLDANFGTTFPPLASDGSNYASSLGGPGAEVIGNCFGYAIAYDQTDGAGADDILIAGAIGDANGAFYTYNGTRVSGGAVMAFNTSTGSWDTNFDGSGQYGPIGAVWMNQPTAPGDQYSEGEADGITVDPSNGDFYVGGVIRAQAVHAGVPDPYGNFVGAFSADGSGNSYFALTSPPTQYTGNPWFGTCAGIQVLSGGNIIAGFDDSASGSGVSIVGLTPGMSANPLWTNGPGEAWIAGSVIGPTSLSANPVTGDIALAITPSSSYAELLWVNGSSGEQRIFADPDGNVSQSNVDFGDPVFQSDGSVTVAGIIQQAYDQSGPTALTLADYQWDNTLPVWLSSTSSLLSWNPSTQILNLFGPATVISDPSAVGDDPFITAYRVGADLTVDPTNGSGSIHINTLALLGGATAQYAPTSSPDEMTVYFNGLYIDVGSGSELDGDNSKMIISYQSGSDPVSTIAAYLTSGYDDGTWGGVGIYSSAAHEDTSSVTDLGYADGADGVVSGLPSGQIEIMYTLAGDANLDGKVNGADFAILSSNFNQAVTGWDQGDFNYDGKCNGSDFSLLSQNFNQGI